MAMDLGIGIKVDPTDSVHKADAVTAALHKTEDAGTAAGQAMLGLAGSFKSLGAAIQQHQAALERTNTTHRALTSSATAASSAFGKMGEAIRKEQEMLERIHGPAKRYAEDLQALDSLLSRQVISTQQYADQVTKLNHAIDGVPKAPIAQAAPAASPLAGVGSALHGAAAVAGIGIGTKELGDLADAYTNIQNRLNLMTGDQAKANVLFGQLRVIAKDSRSDLEATVDAYAGMSRATKQLGLSQEQTLRATKTLNELVTTSGRSASESAAGLLQFSQALSSGRLQGDELRSVFENMPTLVEALEKSLGVTQAQLRKMGEAGQITSQVMVDALLGASAAADASLGKSIPTISQSITAFKNDVLVAVGQLNSATGASKLFGEALSAVASVVSGVLGAIGELADGLNRVGISGGTAAAGLAGMVAAGPIGAIAGVTVAIAAQAGAFEDVLTPAAQYIERLDKLKELQGRLNDSVKVGGSTFADAATDLVAYNLQLNLGADAADAFRRSVDKARGAWFKQQITGGSFDDGSVAFMKNYVANNAQTYAPNSYYSKRLEDVAQAKQLLVELNAAKDYLPNDQYEQEYKRLTDIINGTVDALHKGKKAVDEYREIIKSTIEPEQKAWREANLLGQAYMNGSINAAQYNRELEKRLDLLRKLHVLNPDSVTGGQITGDSALGHLAAVPVVPAAPLPFSGPTAEQIAKAEKERTDELTKSWHDRIKALEQDNKHFAESFKPVGDAMRDAFMKGEVSAKSLDESLRAVAYNLFKLGAIQAAGSFGWGGAASAILGGFATGGSFRVDHTGGRYALPRAAYGADWTVGGTGSTDSKIAMFRVTPGERVRVDTQAQQMSERASSRSTSAERPLVNVIQRNSPREVTAAFGTRAGETVINESNRRWRRSG